MSNIHLYILASCITFIAVLAFKKIMYKQIVIGDIFDTLPCAVFSPLFIIIVVVALIIYSFIYWDLWWNDNPPIKKKIKNILNKKIA